MFQLIKPFSKRFRLPFNWLNYETVLFLLVIPSSLLHYIFHYKEVMSIPTDNTFLQCTAVTCSKFKVIKVMSPESGSVWCSWWGFLPPHSWATWVYFYAFLMRSVYVVFLFFALCPQVYKICGLVLTNYTRLQLVGFSVNL